MPAGEPLLIRPRGPGEVLDQAGLLIRGTFAQSFRAVLIGYLPWSVLVSLMLVPGAEKLNSGAQPLPEDVYRHIGWIVAYLVVDVLLLRQFVRGWLFAIAGAWLRGMTVTSGAAAWHGLRRLPAASTATLLTGGLVGAMLPLLASMASQEPAVVGVVMLTTPLLLLAGLPILFLGYVAVAVVELERKGPFAAVARSFRLCGPGFWIVLLLAVVITLVRFSCGLVPALFPNLWIQSVLNTAFSAGLVILDVAVETVLYFTLRCRREDYDLELMSREVEVCGADEVESVVKPLGLPRFGV